MSHNIEYRDYPEKVDRVKITDALDDYVSHCTWREGGGGLPSEIRWLDREPIYGSREEAEERIETLDKGWYDCLAVRYRKSSKKGADPGNSSAVQKAFIAVKKAREDYLALKDKAQKDFFNRKSEFVGCRECGSKISLRHLKRAVCPVCGKTLLSPTMADRIEKAQKRVVAMQEKHKDEYSKARKKSDELGRQDKSGEVRWLVKFEYHT